MNGKWLAIGSVSLLAAVSRARGSRARRYVSLRHPEGITIYGDEPWREPDYEGEVWGEPYALWWGPSKNFEDAESIIEVEGMMVRTYTCLEGYVDEPEWEEGRPDWSVQEIELGTDDISDAFPGLRNRGLSRSNPRWRAAIAYDAMEDTPISQLTVTQKDIDDLNPGISRKE